MKIAVEGCCHGELDNIYAALLQLQEIDNIKIDLLICCGDFQAVRDQRDMTCLTVPPKYRQMQDFHKYYTFMILFLYIKPKSKNIYLSSFNLY